ncbi:hypothetical protein SLOPH_2491 [Spraguea lophii 42_110]|uniref:Uncharacterized protein n=1 Tax=Spraguea lophii (strain 42_110) TaxID=1358809 RepID=S7WDP8_SPRLO|nr:hypothetical protein SLOPH_2491 [Spraguea lophii 42_110]
MKSEFLYKAKRSLFLFIILYSSYFYTRKQIIENKIVSRLPNISRQYIELENKNFHKILKGDWIVLVDLHKNENHSHTINNWIQFANVARLTIDNFEKSLICSMFEPKYFEEVFLIRNGMVFGKDRSFNLYNRKRNLINGLEFYTFSKIDLLISYFKGKIEKSREFINLLISKKYNK